jgi:CBS domain-containing protein
MKKVKDYMSKRVVYLRPDDTIFKAAKIFCKKGISGAPVVDSGTNKRIVGVISESDVVRFMGTKICNVKNFLSDLAYQSLSIMFLQFINMGKNHLRMRKKFDKLVKIRVKDVMSKKVVSVSPEDSIFDAAEKMDSKKVNRLPVVKKRKLVGIIARADLVRALCD